MYFGCILLAAFLFSLQFLAQQDYQKICGRTWGATLDFTVYSSAVSVVLLSGLRGLQVSFSWYAFWVAFACAVSNILFFYTGMKAFTHANLSVFSVFAMLGGMLLPFAYGILFCGEVLTVSKMASCILVLLALLPAMKPGGGSRKGLPCYLGVFVCNGMIGVFSKVHQTGSAQVDSISFLLLVRLWMVLLALAFKAWHGIGGKSAAALPGASGRDGERKKFFLDRAIWSPCIWYGLISGIGNLLTLIAMKYLPVSVQYPVITGGVMICSAGISLLRREKVTRQDIRSAGIAFCAALIIILPV